jgi:hypothetical protein
VATMSTADVRASQIVVGFWRRVFADLLDSLVLMIFGFAIGYPFRHAFSSMGLHALWVGLACSFLYFRQIPDQRASEAQWLVSVTGIGAAQRSTSNRKGADAQ